MNKAHSQALAVGYESISHDLVYGLPFQTLEMMKVKVENTIKLKPHRISLYSYAHVPRVIGVGQMAYDVEDLPSPSEKQELFQFATKELLKAGYEEVGMDHFALPDDELRLAKKNGNLSRNFMGYTTKYNEQLMGLGMSAISSGSQGYAQNEKGLKQYLDQVASNNNPIVKGHLNTEKQFLTAKLITQLICNYYVQIPDSLKTLESFKKTGKQLDAFIDEGFIVLSDNLLQVNEKGKPFIRLICSAFDEFFDFNSTKNQYSKAI
ncbi:MAG: hypothetical protein HRT74_12880 [Flavobacteriales bacterium]|nr:hypothetical protein [Flavobacteriales bacterium]